MTDETPDVEAFFQTMQGLPAPDQYTAMDKYRDFRAVFMASEQGRRVLREILSWGHTFTTTAPFNPVDPHRVMFNEGARNLTLRLLTVLNKEPVDRPATVNRSKGDS